MASVTLERLNKTFGSTHIIKDVDLKVGDGEFVVFVGPSGCGSSRSATASSGSPTTWSTTCRPASAAWAWSSSPTPSTRT